MRPAHNCGLLAFCFLPVKGTKGLPSCTLRFHLRAPMLFPKLLVRSICTGAVRQAPAIATAVGGKYASAIYSAALKTKALDGVTKEINSYEAEVERDVKLKRVILDPFIHKSEKKKVVFAAADKVKCSDLTKRFLGLIADNGRMEMLDEIFGAFKQMIAAHRGELTCEVTTAKPMDASMKSALEKVLQSFGKGEKQMHTTYKTDPSLVAGMTVSIGNQFIDMSAASKIEQYREILESEL
uniref:Oligomycin sensitivity conferral protein n=1 Tax=Trichuris muris TaxID=70415 RepID=A0A5S6Q8B3_TRIMR